MAKRFNVRDRATVEPPAPVEAPESVEVDEPGSAAAVTRTEAPAPAQRSRRRSAPAVRSQRAVSTAQADISVAITSGELTEAKGAYLVDLRDPTGPRSFSEWIAALVDAHNRRGATGRDAVRAELPERSGDRRVPRRWAIDATVVQAIGEQIAEEMRGQSQSDYIVEAIRSGIESARDRNGGQLPDPPARLPGGPRARRA